MKLVFLSHYLRRIHSGLSFSNFLSRKTKPKTHNDPITNTTWIKIFIKDLKRKNSSYQQLSPQLQTIILKMSRKESRKYILTGLLLTVILVLA